MTNDPRGKKKRLLPSVTLAESYRLCRQRTQQALSSYRWLIGNLPKDRKTACPCCAGLNGSFFRNVQHPSGPRHPGTNAGRHARGHAKQLYGGRIHGSVSCLAGYAKTFRDSGAVFCMTSLRPRTCAFALTSSAALINGYSWDVAQGAAPCWH